MKKVKVLDVFRLGDKYNLSDSYSYRLLIRLPNYNTFALISLGTGESTTHGTGEEIVNYLNGNNNLNCPFEYYGNLVDLLKDKEVLPGFTQNFAKISIS